MVFIVLSGIWAVLRLTSALDLLAVSSLLESTEMLKAAEGQGYKPDVRIFKA